MDKYHVPVLLDEVLKFLDIKKDQWYLDCTLGDGGHSLEIIKRDGKVVGIDQDQEALERTGNRLQALGYSDRYKLKRGNFGRLEELVGEQRFDGILFDLGVSSLQLDDPKRGFSFNKEALLDMRMDSSLTVSALDLINGLNKGELKELFLKLGEYSDTRVVNEILKAREIKRIETTTELARIVEKAVGGKKGKIHPATQIFQALRIAVNDELNSLRAGLEQAEKVLNKNGIILVISFHSLEDRIIKNIFRNWQSRGFGQVVTERPIVPTEAEITKNPRSRSAKLRIFKKI